ncbi:MAG: CehA/McbA family metallohydrolase [Bacteroidota bacterium]
MKSISCVLFILVMNCANIYTQTVRYYKTQLHCHSTRSDGKLSPFEVATEYKSRGYEILFISDHNIMTPADSINLPGLICINAEEYTFSKHINGLFVDHTVNADGFTAQQAVDSIKSQGGLVQFNHPVKMEYGPDWTYPINYFDELNRPDFIEIFNASTAKFAPINIEIWDYLLSNNIRIYGTAADDMHKTAEADMIPMIDAGWIMLKLSSLEKDSVYTALKRGDFYASTGIDITNFNVHEDEISISCSNCSKIKFIGEYGTILKETKNSEAGFSRTDEKYVRVELEDNGIIGIGKKKAWTQPVFYDDKTDIEIAETNLLSLKCYPNPFVSDLTIAYSLTKDDNIKVQMFDYTGKEVKILINQFQQAGDYSLELNGNDLEEGMYYCILTTSDQTLTNKVVLIR